MTIPKVTAAEMLGVRVKAEQCPLTRSVCGVFHLESRAALCPKGRREGLKKPVQVCEWEVACTVVFMCVNSSSAVCHHF